MSNLGSLIISGYSLDMSNLNLKDKTNGKKPKINRRDLSLYEYAINTTEKIHRKNNAHKFSNKDKKDVLEKVIWAGFRNRYYCAIIKPEYMANSFSIEPVSDEKLDINFLLTNIKLSSTNTIDLNSTIYVGPEQLDVLKGYNLGFEKIRRYYRLGIFDITGKLVYNIVHFIYKIIPNWGICILLLSIIVYFTTYPLTLKSMTSMKKMQMHQPEINRIKDKHKNNPQKAQQETMEYFKKNKINPMGGCLPMLLQMPIFIGLYQALWRDVSFKGAAFLWIKDLSEPDRLVHLPFTIPLINSEYINILPILMMGIMFLQQKFSSKNMVVTDSSQAEQQKMMAKIMPILLGFIFYKFASGLTLYFTMFYLFSTFTQWKMSKEEKVS